MTAVLDHALRSPVGEDYTELFDLKEDPLEIRSVLGHTNQAEVQAQLEKELQRLSQELLVPAKFPEKAFGN